VPPIDVNVQPFEVTNRTLLEPPVSYHPREELSYGLKIMILRLDRTSLRAQVPP